MPGCPHCDVDRVAFPVPESLREHAPECAATAAICPRCLRVTAVEDGDDAVDSAACSGAPIDDPAFGRVDGSFPGGEGGAAFALLLGTLPDMTLEKASALAIRDHAEATGVDVALTLDRLVDADLDPHFQLERRVSQFHSLLG